MDHGKASFYVGHKRFTTVFKSLKLCNLKLTMVSFRLRGRGGHLSEIAIKKGQTLPQICVILHHLLSACPSCDLEA